MYISAVMSHSIDASAHEDRIQPQMRLSELLAALSGVMALGMVCLLLLAGLVGEAEDVASVSKTARDS